MLRGCSSSVKKQPRQSAKSIRRAASLLPRWSYGGIFPVFPTTPRLAAASTQLLDGNPCHPNIRESSKAAIVERVLPLQVATLRPYVTTSCTRVLAIRPAPVGLSDKTSSPTVTAEPGWRNGDPAVMELQGNSGDHGQFHSPPLLCRPFNGSYSLLE